MWVFEGGQGRGPTLRRLGDRPGATRRAVVARRRLGGGASRAEVVEAGGAGAGPSALPRARSVHALVLLRAKEGVGAASVGAAKGSTGVGIGDPGAAGGTIFEA